MRSGIRLGSLYGAPIVADASAFILALLFGVAVLVDLRRASVGSPDTDWLIATLAGVAVVGCVLVHELAHSVAAHRLGLQVRAIRLYLFGGYSIIDGVRSAATEFAVSAAGPVASLLLSIVFLIPGLIAGSDSSWGRAFLALAAVNAIIGVFNLIPGFPLDGGRMLRGALTARGRDRVEATRTVTTIGQISGYVVMGVGVVLLMRLGPVGLLVIAAGWFLHASATSAGRREQLSAAFDGVTVRDVMRVTPDAVHGTSTITSILDLYALGPRLRTLPVQVDGRVVGVLGQDEIDSVAPSRWPSVRAKSLMTPIGPADVVDADDPLDTLLLRPAGPARRVVVVEDNVAVGIIDGEDLAKALPEYAAPPSPDA
jgi:Zn-dependent protease/predicted transcriptional regulator